ncbi:MAG: HlyD family efflux transporter periplasmic adaptor subunit [Pseudomonadota bacterium]
MNTEAQRDAGLQQAQSDGVAVLDQSLWAQFHEAGSAEAFVHAWLGLQCRNLPGALASVVVLGEPDVGPFTPVATWPRDNDVSPDLMHAGNEAVSKRQSVVIEAQQDQLTLAVPIEMDGRIFGTVAVSFGSGGLRPVEALRQLKWGAGWLEALLRRDQSATDAALRARTMEALDFVSVVLENRNFPEAASALVTELAGRLDCGQVALGLVRRKRCKVVSLSHVSGFGARMNLVRDLGLAMDEAMDQGDIVLYPLPESWDYRVTRHHEELARALKAGSVLTIPLLVQDEPFGALTFERPEGRPFDEQTVELCDVVASMVAPVLAERRRNDRWLITKIFAGLWQQITLLLGPRYLGRKLATIIFAGLVWLAATTYTDFRIPAPAQVEGAVQRTVVAPFNGYLQSETVRAGARVQEGDVLATLNDQDLTLERLRLTTARSQREIEYSQALATGERAQARIIRSQIDQADAQLGLIDAQLSRTRVTAPFDGIIVAGDLSQSVGTAVERGQELFRVAPLDAFRVALEIDEADIAEIEQGQQGELRLAASPDQSLALTVQRITPVARQRDGRNFFRVEASLDRMEDGRLNWVRPSMEGVARVSVDRRLLVAVWSRRLRDWLRLTAWRFSP